MRALISAHSIYTNIYTAYICYIMYVSVCSFGGVAFAVQLTNLRSLGKFLGGRFRSCGLGSGG